MGEFTGFSFGDWHSTDPETGVVVYRVSGGDRYEEELHPEIKDRTAEVPGVNGEYYFGSDYGTKTFDIEIAFDHLTEIQFKKLRKVFGTKEIKQLIFDECPYKYYMAKLESPVELSYVCFDERTYIDDGSRGTGIKDRELRTLSDTTSRIYKGEGKMTFVCYFPFAKSTFKVLPEQGEAYYEGSEEWAVSSGILSAENYILYDTYTIPQTGTPYIKVYNPGDIETGFRMYIPQALLTTETILTYMSNFNQDIASLSLNSTEMKNGDVGILIDTNSSLIIGVSSAPTGPNPTTGEYTYTTSGNLYNEIIESGYFFKIKTTPFNTIDTIQIEGGGEGIQIFYDYLYF